jgi:hypothetical protein
MSQAGQILDQMAAGLQSGLPHRIVARSLKDFAEIPEEKLLQGVYTFICRGLSGEVYRRYIDFLLVGQIKTAEGAGGLAIEEAELTMIDEVLRFQSAVTLNIPFERIIQSRQLEAPYGWINAESRVGPFDFCYGDPEGIGDFITFHAESGFGGTADDPVMITEEILPQ